MNAIIESNDKSKGSLFVGNYRSAELDWVNQHKIGAVITAAKDSDVSYPNTNIKHMVLTDADDVEEYDITKYFDSTFKFIDENISKTNVLVHCFAGCQRSVTIVTAYLIRKNKMDDVQALTYVQERRKIADPNDGFRKQLSDFAKKLGTKSK